MNQYYSKSKCDYVKAISQIIQCIIAQHAKEKQPSLWF